MECFSLVLFAIKMGSSLLVSLLSAFFLLVTSTMMCTKRYIFGHIVSVYIICWCKHTRFQWSFALLRYSLVDLTAKIRPSFAPNVHMDTFKKVPKWNRIFWVQMKKQYEDNDDDDDNTQILCHVIWLLNDALFTLNKPNSNRGLLNFCRWFFLSSCCFVCILLFFSWYNRCAMASQSVITFYQMGFL